jgi:hypothetical protein
MKHFLFSFFIGLCWLTSTAQDTVETVHISKQKTRLYQGLGQELSSWYLYVDQQGIWYMANLFIPTTELKAWFESKKDSQNILKGILNAQGVKTLTLTRENEPENAMRFYVELNAEKNLVLIQIENSQSFVFEELIVR